MKHARALRHDALQIKIKDTPKSHEMGHIAAGESRSYAALKARLNASRSGGDRPQGSAAKPTVNGASYAYKIKIMCGILTGLWIVGALIYGAFYVGEVTPMGVGLFITAVFAPPAFMWGMVNAFMPLARGQSDATFMPADVAALPDTINAYTAALEDALARSRMSVKQNIFDLQTHNDTFEASAARVEKQIANMNGLSQDGLNTAEKIADTLDRKAHRIDETLSTRSADLHTIAEGLIDTVKRAEQYGLKAAARLTKTLSIAKAETQNLTTVLDDGVTRFETSAQNASKHVDKIITRTGEHTAMLKNIGASYSADIETFGAGLDDKIMRLEDVQKAFNTPVRNLQEIIEDAEKRCAIIEEKFNTLNTTLNNERKALIGDIDDSRAQARKQVDVLKNLSQNINQSLSALNTAQTIDEFERLLQSAAQAHTTLEGLSTATVKAQKHTRGLTDTAEHTAHIIKVTGDDTRKHIEDMLKITQEKIERIHAREQDIVTAAAQTANTLEGTLKHVKILHDDITVNIAKLSKESEAATTKITRQNTTLQSQMDAIATAGSVAAKQLDTAHISLNHKTQNFMDVSAAALNAAHDASDIIQTHSKALLSAAQTARNVAEDIKTKHIKTREQETIESGEFILESLHSVAVDLNRITQGGVPEKLWKAYQGGEKNIFTKAMLSIIDKIPTADLTLKFKSDTDFRTAVLRFTTRFEEFLSDINLGDEGVKTSQSLLQEAIITSDVAKLYIALCEIAGKRNIL